MTVNGQEFVEAMRLHDDAPDLPWTTVKFIPSSAPSAPIRYELWNEGGVVSGPDRPYAINPQVARKHLEFTFQIATHACSGDVSGVHDGPASAVQSEAPFQALDPAWVRLYVAFP